MDGQDPPNRPRYQLTRGLIGLDSEKRRYDVILTRQEVCTRRHLANVHSDWSCRYFIQNDFFCRLAGPVAPTGKAIVHWIGY